MTNENTWNKFHNVFNKDNTGSVASASFLSRYNSADKTYDFFISNVEEVFAIAEDMYVTRTTDSYMGGLF